jgi:NAD(P)-dependent dehydrogenase (short-subunit alcohol dehydrogenase family)
MSNSHAPDGAAVVVGATGSLGGTAVRAFLGRGLDVIGVARSAEKLQQLAAEHDRFTACPADIADDRSIGQISDAVTGPVKVAFMGAGLPVRGSVETSAPGDYALAMNVKVGGLVRLLRGVGDRLGAGGRIIVLSGYHGIEPRPHETMPGVINAALHNFVRQLGDLYGPRGITIHAISPGPVDTPRLRSIAARAAEERGVDMETQMATYTAEASSGAFVTLEQIGWVIDSLLDDEAVALHGSVLSLDGGRLRSIR